MMMISLSDFSFFVLLLAVAVSSPVLLVKFTICFTAGMKDHIVFFMKNISLFLIVMKRSKWLQVIERETKDLHCYHWHNLRDKYSYWQHVVIDLYSEPQLVLVLLLGPYKRDRIFSPHPRRHSLTALLIWANLYLISVSRQRTSKYYVIFSTPTRILFRFSIHVIYFLCPLVYTGAVSFFKKSTITDCLRLICNTI